MYRTIGKLMLIPFAAALTACSQIPQEGVSAALAKERKADVGNVKYSLRMTVPLEKSLPIPSDEEICFEASGRRDVVLDFREEEDKLLKVSANGREVPVAITNGHIVIPRRFLGKGSNSVRIEFTAGELSLNRRDKFLYTLLVPDRACTLFPCFDQPDMKAEYSLTLNLPEEWTAISNSAIESETAPGNGSKTIAFAPTEPLSTYLFSFVCGEFERVTEERGGRTISIYHRENDPAKAAQCPSILQSIFDALDYMEEYTAMPYPFSKYDCVAIPDFQYGGMEHTGATLYNDRSLFLDPDPTTAELQNRESLLAHETAHMWFGDCVTMRWFDDVWTKEVFANWFAARMTRPKFPQINFTVSDIYNYYVSSYSEDRTIGSNAIQRPLDNLRNAGLIYCNIIYDKAPVVLEKLNRKMGEDALRDGLREYLREYKFGNACWDDLIEILQKRADFDLREWSRVWIKEKGMPEYDAEGRCIDPFGNGNVWQQDVLYTEAAPGIALPNIDGTAYGCFRLDAPTAQYIYDNFETFDATARFSLCVNLYENMLRGFVGAGEFQEWLCGAIRNETDPLIFSYMSGCIADAALLGEKCRAVAQDALRAFVDSDASAERRLIAFRTFASICRTPEDCNLLYDSWKDSRAPHGLPLGESDRTSLSYQLMLLLPEKAQEIADIERERITNSDRRETFDYICRAASPDAEVRRELFESFSSPEGRRPESRVRKALSLLCSPLRGEEAISYIRPALDLLPEVQKYGDIFFPSTWCRSLLSTQKSPEARAQVTSWLAEHPEMNPLLRTKVEQAAGILPGNPD